MPRKILPHAAILLCNMYFVFYVLDHVNSAMQFIDNGITKGLLAVLCVISTINASFLILDERRRQAAKARRRAAAGGTLRKGTATRAAQPRQVQAARPAGKERSL